jgi:hypothetical protein
VAGESCQVDLASLEELRKLAAGVEARGLFLPDYRGALFRSPELKRLELAAPLPGLPTVADLPVEVRRLLGWPEKGPLTPGAYRAGR